MCLLCSLLIFALSGCEMANPKPTEKEEAGHMDVLHAGDRIRVDISGTPEVIAPIETEVHEDGSINLPYVGRVPAADKSATDLEKDITKAYVPAFFPHIGISITLTARFFYVGGQVSGAGNTQRILYTGPTTVLRAIQAAGDFNPYANKRKVQITRSVSKKIYYENCVKALEHPELDLPVYPNDMVWVGRRGVF